MTLGATTTLEPAYFGARRLRLFGLPSVSVRPDDEPEEFGAPEDGLDYTLLGSRTFQVGPVANLRGGRTELNGRQLAGLKTYPDTVDAGAFLNIWPVERVMRIRLEVRQGLRPQDGLVADLNSDLIGHIGRFTVSGGPRFSFGDFAANQLELGINAAEATRNGQVPPFRASAGPRSVGFGLALSYDWSDRWRTTVFHRFDHLVLSAAESPITRSLGTADQSTFGLSLTYAFNVNVDP